MTTGDPFYDSSIAMLVMLWVIYGVFRFAAYKHDRREAEKRGSLRQ